VLLAEAPLRIPLMMLPRTIFAAALLAASLSAAAALPVLSLDKSSYTFHENDGNAVFIITRTGDLSGSSSALWAATIDGIHQSGSKISFAPNETTKTVAIPIANDDIYDIRTGGDYFELYFESGATLEKYYGTPVKILDDEPVPQVNVTDVAVAEGDFGETIVHLKVTLSNPFKGYAEYYATIAYPITATIGKDFTGDFWAPNNGQFTTTPWTTGQTSADLVVRIIGDTDPEPDEMFTVSVYLGGFPGKITATVTILNDDYILKASSDRIAIGTATTADIGSSVLRPRRRDRAGVNRHPGRRARQDVRHHRRRRRHGDDHRDAAGVARRRQARDRRHGLPICGAQLRPPIHLALSRRNGDDHGTPRSVAADAHRCVLEAKRTAAARDAVIVSDRHGRQRQLPDHSARLRHDVDPRHTAAGLRRRGLRHERGRASAGVAGNYAHRRPEWFLARRRARLDLRRAPERSLHRDVRRCFGLEHDVHVEHGDDDRAAARRWTGRRRTALRRCPQHRQERISLRCSAGAFDVHRPFDRIGRNAHPGHRRQPPPRTLLAPIRQRHGQRCRTIRPPRSSSGPRRICRESST
jgi:hypothetical protein